MDELLNAVLQRKSKINEITETISKLKSKNSISQSERSTIYAIIRKLKEDEKNRTEKENWIISIMRNTKSYSEDQMCHIYVKTNDIMKQINSQFLESAYQQPNNLYQFLEQYYNLHQGFFQQMNQEYQLKVQYKQAIKLGNSNLITDLIKALLASSRKIFKDFVDDLAYQVNKEMSPEKQKQIKKLIPDPLVEHLRTRSSTQNGKKEGTIISMTSSVVQSDEASRMIEKKEMQLIRDKIKQQQRKFILQPRLTNQEIIFLDSPIQQLKQKYQINKDNERLQFSSLYSNVNIEDLDDQNICVLEYQTIKRQSQGFEEFKLNFESLLEKIKQRNIIIQQSVSDYNQYTQKKEIEFTALIKEKYDLLVNDKPNSPLGFHYCKTHHKPIHNSQCICFESSKSDINPTPIKNKIVIRKSVQSIRKSANIQQNLNTFTSKNLIDQLKKERSLNQSILLEETDLYRFNNSGVSPVNNSILNIRKLDSYTNGNSKLYKLTNDIQPFKQTSIHLRAQSANGDQMPPPLLVRNCAE